MGHNQSFTSNQSTNQNTINTQQKTNLIAGKIKALKAIFQETDFYKHRLIHYTCILLKIVPPEKIKRILPSDWKNRLESESLDSYTKHAQNLNKIIQWWSKEGQQFERHSSKKLFEAVLKEKVVFNHLKKSDFPSTDEISELYQAYRIITQLFALPKDKHFETVNKNIQTWHSKVQRDLQLTLDQIFISQNEIKSLKREVMQLDNKIQNAEKECMTLSKKKESMLKALQSTFEAAVTKNPSPVFPHNAINLFMVHIKRLIDISDKQGNKVEPLPIHYPLIISDLQKTIDQATIKIVQEYRNATPNVQAQYEKNLAFQALVQYYNALLNLKTKQKTLEALYVDRSSTEVETLDQQDIQITQLSQIETLTYFFCPQDNIIQTTFNTHPKVQTLFSALHKKYQQLQHLMQNYTTQSEQYEFWLLQTIPNFERKVENSPISDTIDDIWSIHDREAFTAYQQKLSPLMQWWSEKQLLVEHIARYQPTKTELQQAIRSFQTMDAIQKNWMAIQDYASGYIYQPAPKQDYYTLLDQFKTHHMALSTLFSSVTDSAKGLIETIETTMRTHCFNNILTTPGSRLSCILHHYFGAFSQLSFDSDMMPSSEEQFYCTKLDRLLTEYLEKGVAELTPIEYEFFLIVKAWRASQDKTVHAYDDTLDDFLEKIKPYMEQMLNAAQRLLIDEMHALKQGNASLTNREKSNTEEKRPTTQQPNSFFKQKALDELYKEQQQPQLTLCIPR